MTAPGALDGLLVVDPTTLLLDPCCTMMLGDLGAEVIKVERSEGGEARRMPPFVDGRSQPFALWNRNKRSLTPDLKDEPDRSVLWELVARADVPVENFRPGALARAGRASHRPVVVRGGAGPRRVRSGARAGPRHAAGADGAATPGQLALPGVPHAGRLDHHRRQQGCVLACALRPPRPELAEDRRFATNADRVRNNGALVPLLQAALETRDSAHWLAGLSNAGIPGEPVLSYDEALARRQAVARGVIGAAIPDRARGEVRTLSPPLRLGGTPAALRQPSTGGVSASPAIAKPSANAGAGNSVSAELNPRSM